jgi:hypothetical protein
MRLEDAASLSRLAEELRRFTGVTEVDVNPLGKSLLLKHTGALAPILDEAASAGLLSVVSAPALDEGPLTSIYDHFAALDRRLKTSSSGWGLATWAFYGLAGASVYQLVRGRFLPAGGALAFQALSILLQGREIERKPAP